MSLFLRGLVRLSVLFIVRCVVGDSSRVVQDSSVLFVVVVFVGASFVYRQGVFCFFDRSLVRAFTVPMLYRPCGIILAAVAY